MVVGTGIPLFGLGMVVHAAGVLPAHTALIVVTLIAYPLAPIIWIVFHYRLRLRQEDRLDRLAESAIKEGLGQATKLYLAEVASSKDQPGA